MIIHPPLNEVVNGIIINTNPRIEIPFGEIWSAPFKYGAGGANQPQYQIKELRRCLKFMLDKNLLKVIGEYDENTADWNTRVELTKFGEEVREAGGWIKYNADNSELQRLQVSELRAQKGRFWWTTGLSITVVFLGVLALFQTNKINTLEQELNEVTLQRDSLSRVIAFPAFNPSITKPNYPDIDEIYLTSTYDLSERNLDAHRADLKELSNSNTFSAIHSEVFSSLNNKHQNYFSSNPYYELLYSIQGDLFQNNKEDYAFIVYDMKSIRISILVFDALRNIYFELYRDIKVNNGLKKSDCNYGAFGTLDYQIGEEVIYQRDYIVKNPKRHLEYSVCKIDDITEDDDFVLEDGCLAKGFSSERNSNSLCISTSSVYNNWECLTYYPSKDVFVIFYGQAFAD